MIFGENDPVVAVWYSYGNLVYPWTASNEWRHIELRSGFAGNKNLDDWHGHDEFLDNSDENLCFEDPLTSPDMMNDYINEYPNDLWDGESSSLAKNSLLYAQNQEGDFWPGQGASGLDFCFQPLSDIAEEDSSFQPSLDMADLDFRFGAACNETEDDWSFPPVQEELGEDLDFSPVQEESEEDLDVQSVQEDAEDDSGDPPVRNADDAVLDSPEPDSGEVWSEPMMQRDLFEEVSAHLDDSEDWSAYLESDNFLRLAEEKAPAKKAQSASKQPSTSGEKPKNSEIPQKRRKTKASKKPEAIQTPENDAEAKPGVHSFKALLNRHKLDIVFYLLLIALIVSIFAFRAQGGPVLLGGYGVFTVATDSMNDVIPKGSLIVTKRVDPNLLTVGDDITYMNGPSSTITHRIIAVKEKSEENEMRQFYTQGTMNAEPDLVPVAAPNVVGKVIYSNLKMGNAVKFIKANWPIILVVLLIVCVWGTVMKCLFRSNKKHQHK